MLTIICDYRWVTSSSRTPTSPQTLARIRSRSPNLYKAEKEVQLDRHLLLQMDRLHVEVDHYVMSCVILLVCAFVCHEVKFAVQHTVYEVIWNRWFYKDVFLSISTNFWVSFKLCTTGVGRELHIEWS